MFLLSEKADCVYTSILSGCMKAVVYRKATSLRSILKIKNANRNGLHFLFINEVICNEITPQLMSLFAGNFIILRQVRNNLFRLWIWPD